MLGFSRIVSFWHTSRCILLGLHAVTLLVDIAYPFSKLNPTDGSAEPFAQFPSQGQLVSGSI
jgi:hypothetical protein